MCQDKLHPFLAALPKCEHHMHLEGALRPSTLFQLAKRNNIQLPADKPEYGSLEALEKRYLKFTSLDDFLAFYFIGMTTLITEEDFEELGWDYFQQAQSDGVKHAEVFFDPEEHVKRGVSFDFVVRGFQKACKRAEAEFGITTELIMCFLRHYPPELSLETFNTASDGGYFADGTLRSIGLSSTELAKKPVAWKAVYDKAKAQGLLLTAHAGEEGDASYIKSALDDLGVTRIDHGVRLAEDDALMKRVADEGIMLTVCPLSNICLKGFPSVSAMPIRKFLDAGVKFSLNSDDPAYFGGYILANYCAVQEAFQLQPAEWELIVSNSIEGSWCSAERKAELKQMLGSVMKEHVSV